MNAPCCSFRPRKDFAEAFLNSWKSETWKIEIADQSTFLAQWTLNQAYTIFYKKHVYKKHWGEIGKKLRGI